MAIKKNELCKRFTSTGTYISLETALPTYSARFTSQSDRPLIRIHLQVLATRGRHASIFTIRTKSLSARISCKLVNATQGYAVISPMKLLPTEPLHVCTSLKVAARTLNAGILMFE